MWLGSKLTALSDYLFRTGFRFLFRYDIFISYARRDGKDYALKLRDQLRQLDFSCFLDFDELPAGNSLTKTLRRALRRSATLVLVGTERAVGSRYVELEVEDFARTGRAIIPIDIEGSLASAPWAVVRERDLVWIDEARAALERGVPSPNVADQIDKLFKYTRRNSRVRAQVLATLGLFVLVVGASLFLIRQQVNAATTAAAVADRERAEAVRQKDAAEQEKQHAREATAVAEKERLAAKAATDASLKAQHEADVALGEAATARKAADEATAEAKRQEQAALASAERASAEQQRAETERARAEEGTRYSQSQAAGAHAALALDEGGELEEVALLAVESLKRSLTPEGYATWERAMRLLPRPLPAGPAFAGAAEVTTIAYEPEGRWLAAARKEGGVTLRPANGGEAVSLESKIDNVTKISPARGGELVALAGHNNFELWDVRGRESMMSLRGYYSGSVAVSPDGRYVAAAGPQRRAHLRVYDTSAPAEPLFEADIKGVTYALSAAFSPDGRWLAVACSQGKVMFWDPSGFAAGAKPQPQVLSLAPQDQTPRHLAFGPQGGLAIISPASGGLTLSKWSLTLEGETLSLKETGFRVRMPLRSDQPNWSVAFSPDENFVALAAQDKTARVWETSGEREVARVGFVRDVDAVALDAGGRLTTVSGGVVESWELDYGPRLVRLRHEGEVKAVAASPSGEWLATASAAGLRLFRTSDWSEVKPRDAVEVASALNFSPDGRWLVVKGDERAVIFDTQTWQVVSKHGPLGQEKDLGMVGSDGIGDVSFSPDGCWLVVEDGRSVKLLEAGSWRERHAFEHTDPVHVVSFSPDGRRMFVGVAGLYQRRLQHIADARVRAYVWSLDDRRVTCATVEDEYTARAEKTETRRAAESLPCPALQGHADEKLFAEAEGWAKVSQAREGPPASPDGRWLVAPDGGADSSLAFKEGNTRRKVASLAGKGRLERWAFTPDSRWLVVAEGEFVMPWPLRPAEMIAGICARLHRRDLPADVWQKYFSGEKTGPTCAP